VVEPEYVRELPAESPMSEWEVDRERGTATLVKPETKLGRLTLPIAPMLGCFGVAPARGEAISTATSGRHGGNMDYRGFAQGATVYFPVLVPGALIHVGDGHALQGDGEIVGTGIEISFDVQFTVRLLKGKVDRLAARGERRLSDDRRQCPPARSSTAACGRPKWTVGCSVTAAWTRTGRKLLMGLAVEYEVGNVFDPAYTMICKMRKSLLAQLGLEIR